jgi:multicomponent Na+:H+ antiporter subunit D
MSPALLTLFVAVPLAASALLTIVRWVPLVRLLHLGIPALSAAGGAVLLAEHGTTPVIAHSVGGFVPGIAIPFVSDTLSALMITVTGLVTVACAVFAVSTGEAALRFFPSLTLMLVAGVNGALLTGDLFNLFVFIEVMLLPSYALIAMTGSWRRLGVGRLFVVVNLLTSTLFLIGVALVYGSAGTVNLGALAQRALDDDRVALAAAVVLLAVAVKAGVVPLHGWLPRAYPGTSAAVMALFSALHTKVAIYAIYRIYSVVYDNDQRWLPLILLLVSATMVVGAFSSLGERSMRRSLAFQMVAGVGYILVGVGLSTVLGLAAGIFYMLHHIVVMGALLLLAGSIEHTYGTGRFTGLTGLMRRERLLAAVFALALMSLIGFPPSSGFFGKVGVVVALAEADPWTAALLIAVVVVASLGTLVAMQKLWSEVFWGVPMEELPAEAGGASGAGRQRVCTPQTRVRGRLMAPGAALLVVSLAVFVLAGPVWDLCVQAAESLLDAETYAGEVLP